MVVAVVGMGKSTCCFEISVVLFMSPLDPNKRCLSHADRSVDSSDILTFAFDLWWTHPKFDSKHVQSRFQALRRRRDPGLLWGFTNL